MKASVEAQLRLLELADLDAELSRLDHRRRSLPELEEYRRIEARDAELRDELAALEATESDLRREQAKAEADVDQVRSRVERDRTRLDAGQVSSPRELENLQSEIASLIRRQSDLEEIVLDVMERQEAAELRRNTLTQEEGALARQRDEVAARRDVALGEISEQEEKAGSLRASVAADVPGDLLDLYGKLRAQHGVGAAALRRGRCEGCHLSLNTVDLARIRAAPPDEVLRCEECRRILVRTPDSGPVTRRLVVEADGGSRGNPGPAGYGAVVRDAATGEVLAEVSESIGRATNNVAEYSGLIAGLRAAAAIARGADVEVRMDSKLVVEQMSGRWQIKHPDMRPLAAKARETARVLGRVSYTWVPRSRNAHADRLANQAMDAAAGKAGAVGGPH